MSLCVQETRGEILESTVDNSIKLYQTNEKRDDWTTNWRTGIQHDKRLASSEDQKPSTRQFKLAEPLRFRFPEATILTPFNVLVSSWYNKCVGIIHGNMVINNKQTKLLMFFCDLWRCIDSIPQFKPYCLRASTCLKEMTWTHDT